MPAVCAACRARHSASRLSPKWWRRHLVIAAIALLLIALAWWTHASIQRSVLEMRATEMTTARDSVVMALRLWIDQEIARAEIVAADPRVVELTTDLVEFWATGPPVEAVRAHPARRELLSVLEIWGGVESTGLKGAVGVKDTRYSTITTNYDEESMDPTARYVRYLLRAADGHTVIHLH